MITVVSCIVREHDLRLVAVAVLICLVGAGAVAQLFGRVLASPTNSRGGWIVLASVTVGTMVWCTHFVAMMAFKTDVPVMLDPLLTMASLGVIILASAPGLALASSSRPGLVAAGGAMVGLAVSAMHYIGMMAYRVDGVVRWHYSYVAASVILSCALSAGAFAVMRTTGRRSLLSGGVVFAVAVATLHFTGMAGFRILVLELHPGQGMTPATMIALASATTCAGLLLLICVGVSILIDGQTKSEAFRSMQRMALNDGLTDLPNRTAFRRRLIERLGQLPRAPGFAVVMIDLTNFKRVNDNYGHQTGDELLVAVATRMRCALRPDEFLARLGGDEFAAISSGTGDPAAGLLSRLAAVFPEPFPLARCNATLGGNIGVAVAPADGVDPDELIACADLAMYRAKVERSVEPYYYDVAMDDAMRDRRDLEADLRRAIAAQDFELHYQVQAAVGGAIVGYEALLRWHHPTRGAISPARFIPIAEDIGEIVALSDWVLARACREAAAWPEPHVVSVNISASHLSDPGFLGSVRRALDGSGLAPGRLTLELTEGAIIRDRARAVGQLETLKALGVGLALDDFGVGYSSLDVLRCFSFDCIKLDASFVAGIDKSDHAVAILRSVVALGNTLHVPVLAEGIEDAAQLRIALREGCSAIQGFLIGRPSRSLVDGAAVSAVMNSAGHPAEHLAA